MFVCIRPICTDSLLVLHAHFALVSRVNIYSSSSSAKSLCHNALSSRSPPPPAPGLSHLLSVGAAEHEIKASRVVCLEHAGRGVHKRTSLVLIVNELFNGFFVLFLFLKLTCDSEDLKSRSDALTC